jgi:hypothetical protein
MLASVIRPSSKRHPVGLGLIADDNPSVMQLEVVPVRVATRPEQRMDVAIEELASSGC